MKYAVAFIALAVIVLQCEGKVFSRCELVRELTRQGFSDLRNWVCLIEKESGSDTSAVRRENNGSRSYGLFQINDGFWCNSSNTPGKGCNARCSDLATSDITKASSCAKIIHRSGGFNQWNAWKTYCQRDLPSISNC